MRSTLSRARKAKLAGRIAAAAVVGILLNGCGSKAVLIPTVTATPSTTPGVSFEGVLRPNFLPAPGGVEFCTSTPEAGGSPPSFKAEGHFSNGTATYVVDANVLAYNGPRTYSGNIVLIEIYPNSEVGRLLFYQAQGQPAHLTVLPGEKGVRFVGEIVQVSSGATLKVSGVINC